MSSAGNTAPYVALYPATQTESFRLGKKILVRLRSAAWKRILVDAALLAGMALASSKLVLPR